MMRLLFVTLFFCTYHFALTQVRFEKGYFIEHTGSRKECLIKNNDKINTPSSFKYKLFEDSEIFTASVEDVKEFGIYEGYKYLSCKVKIDVSSDDPDKISGSKEPEFEERHLFLEVLVEGKADLLFFSDPNLERYFYRLNSSPPQQLIYKKFINANGKVIENKTYIHQLMDKMNNDCFPLKDFTELEYDKKDLVDFFIKYSECNKVETTYVNKKREIPHFNLTLRPGVTYASLNAITGFLGATYEIEYDAQYILRFGLETELILPLGNNKWAIALEPCYQYYSSSKEVNAPNLIDEKFISTISFESIELPVSLRHYFFISDESKLFINLSYYGDIFINSKLESHRLNGEEIHQPGELITAVKNFGFGIGYKHGKRYSFEFRYQTDRGIHAKHRTFSSDYSQISAIFGYSIF